MRIYVNARFLTQPVTGVQRYGIECSRQIKKLYPETIFVCPADVLDHETAKELCAIEFGRSKGHVWEQTDLPVYLKSQGNPPLINLANTAPLFYRNNYLTLHDLAFYLHPEWNSRPFALWYNYLIPRIAKRAKHLFTVSETVKQEIENAYGIPENGITVTYNGLSQHIRETIPQGLNMPKEKVILAVGTFNARKNQGALVKAFLNSNVKDQYELVLVGDKNKVFRDSGLPQDDKKLAEQHIKILEHISETDLIEQYRKAEAIVSVSQYEGFGIPVLEGLYAGCKALCSDIPVYRELFGEDALFCNPGSVESIANGLTKLIQEGTPAPTANLDKMLNVYNYERAATLILQAVTKINLGCTNLDI